MNGLGDFGGRQKVTAGESSAKGAKQSKKGGNVKKKGHRRYTHRGVGVRGGGGGGEKRNRGGEKNPRVENGGRKAKEDGYNWRRVGQTGGRNERGGHILEKNEKRKI